MNTELIFYRTGVKNHYFLFILIFIHSPIYLPNYYDRYCSIHKIYRQHVLYNNPAKYFLNFIS